MNTSDWITLVAAITVGVPTISLAIAAFLSIRQTRKIRENERKHRLINEIIDWAIDVGKCGNDIAFTRLAADMDEQPWGKLTISQIHATLREIQPRGEYIVEISKEFEDSLQIYSQNTLSEVYKYLKSMDEIFISVRLVAQGALDMILEPLSKHESLIQLANNLIKEAVKVKATLINP